jgi:endonuclease G
MYSRKKVLFAVIGLGLILASCSNDLETNCNPDPASSGAPVAVQFTSEIHGAIPQTRTITTWANQNAIGIFMVKDVTSTPSVVNNMLNKQYQTNGSTAFTPVGSTDTIYYPVDGSSVDFISYYPYQSATALGDYSVDVSNQQTGTDIDLLYAKTTSGYSKATKSPVSLLFDHQLTHLVLNTIPGNGLTADNLKNLTVAVKGLNTTATFDLVSKGLKDLGDVKKIVTNISTAGEKYDAIIIPQTIGKGLVTVEFQIGSEIFVWTVPEGTFDAETEYIYNVTISRTGVTVTGEINAWKKGQGDNVSAD